MCAQVKDKSLEETKTGRLPRGDKRAPRKGLLSCCGLCSVPQASSFHDCHPHWDGLRVVQLTFESFLFCK